MTAPILAAHDVSVRLGKRLVLEDATCRLAPGQVLAIVGPNGAGKTTLLRALAGLVRPESGSVSFGETPLDAISQRERARAIAYVPQGAETGWPLAAAAIVALGRLPHGGARRLSTTDHAAIAAAMAATDTLDFADRPVTELSGGERARVLLARALATQAPVLLCDEPVAALDARHQLTIMSHLRAEAERGKAVAIVVHDLALAARFADAVMILREGRVTAFGPPREVMNPRGLADAFGVDAIAEEREGSFLVMPWRLAE
jgi:iron complex transport system ATP-binding protein